MDLLIPLISFFLSLIITWFIKQVCIYHGIVELPRKDRWNKSPVAKFGGIAIFVTFIVSILLLDQFSDLVIFIGIGSALIFFIGLIDDIISVSPTIKLLTQANFQVFFLLSLPLAPNPLYLLGIIIAIEFRRPLQVF